MLFMDEQHKIFLKFVAASLGGTPVKISDMPDFWRQGDDRSSRQNCFSEAEGTVGKRFVYFSEIAKIAKEQAVTALIYDYLLEQNDPSMPRLQKKTMQMQLINMAGMYYRMVNFVRRLQRMLDQLCIQGCILKGVGLGQYYPKEELRKAGDVDVYVPVPADFEKLCSYLCGHGFEEEGTVTDHHRTFYQYENGIRMELEVHKKTINSQQSAVFNRAVEHIYAPFAKKGATGFSKSVYLGGSVEVLPLEENLFYLLLHMLQHFLSGGMGIRMLCDWALIWQQETVNVPRFFSFVHETGIVGFTYMITGICVCYLGLPMKAVPWMEGHMPSQVNMQAFLKDIFDGGEFGQKDSARMLAVAADASAVSYLKEFHRQMRLRFRRVGSCPLLWPFLWVCTGVIFVWNNLFLRKTSVRAVIKSAGERGRLLDSLQLFEKGQSKEKVWRDNDEKKRWFS